MLLHRHLLQQGRVGVGNVCDMAKYELLRDGFAYRCWLSNIELEMGIIAALRNALTRALARRMRRVARALKQLACDVLDCPALAPRVRRYAARGECEWAACPRSEMCLVGSECGGAASI